jgi:NTE family protein
MAMSKESHKEMKKKKKILVLSGGGGRGAYQVGVCQVLSQKGWTPDIVLGNSIGATNGALFLAPKDKDICTTEVMEHVWLNSMPQRDFHHASNEWSPVLQPVVQLVIDALLESHRSTDRVDYDQLLENIVDAIIAQMEKEQPGAERSAKSALTWLFKKLIQPMLKGQAIMDRTGWIEVLDKNVDFDKLNNPKKSPHFGIAVTDVKSGALRLFWNRVPAGAKGEQAQLTIDHIIASANIPAVYQSTTVKDTNYWDGALVANTPLSPVIEIIKGSENVEVIVVLMSPFPEEPDPPITTPPKILDGLNHFIDWMMLAPFRQEYDQLEAKHKKKIHIIAPKKLQGILSVIDYRQKPVGDLIEQGVIDATK